MFFCLGFVPFSDIIKFTSGDVQVIRSKEGQQYLSVIIFKAIQHYLVDNFLLFLNVYATFITNRSNSILLLPFSEQLEVEVGLSAVSELFGPGLAVWELGLEFLFIVEAVSELILHLQFLFPKLSNSLLFAQLMIFGRVLQAFSRKGKRHSPSISWFLRGKFGQRVYQYP